MESIQQNGKMLWAGRIVSGLVVLPFVMGAVMSFVGGPEVAQGMAQMGMPEKLLVPVAVLNILSFTLYLIPRTSVLGAILMTGYIGGAILTHLRVGQAVPLQVTLGILVWLGLWLRDPRLRALLPIRR